ncbi:MAG: DUF4145 domain-containing protein, partial [Selenomonadales bacterium]|nr:DUF4145 domain-containing protein [Selenomonadales bacterium]
MSRFDFLYNDFKALYDKCVQAEEATDVNFKMLMVRQSLEYIVRELGERGNDLFQSISNLSDRDILDEEISDLFHETSMLTNRGVHGQSVSTYDTQTAINNLVEITIWYAAEYKEKSFRLNQFSAEDIGRAKQYVKDDSYQGVSQAEYLAVDVDPLATVGTFQTTWDETVNPLEKDVFETEAEYEKRIAQMEPVRIGYGVLNTEKKDGYTDVQFLQHHIERNKVIQFVKAPVYFFAQNAPVSGVIDGEIVARLRVHDHRVCCDYSRIYLRNGEQDIPIRFICWQKTDYETDADYRKRVETLPILPLGLCMPIRSRYDIEKQQLPFETKKFAYVPFAISAIYTVPCDRDLAKRVCMQKEPFIVFGNILLNKTMERTLIWGKETGIVYDNEVVWSLNSLGIRYYNEENYIEAVKCFHQAAEQGYAAAQNNLGDCYQYG